MSSLVLLLGFYWIAPDWLVLSEGGMIVRAITVQVGGPLVATVAAAFAFRRSSGNDRLAWLAFTIGSALYFAGNFSYMVLAVNGVTLTFPSYPEAAYFVMAAFFAGGMFIYAKARRRITSVQIYNLIRVYCVVTLAVLFMLNGPILTTKLAPFATFLAFLYPALWLSVAVSGVVALIMAPRGRSTFAFILMVTAVTAEALADFRYAEALLKGTDGLGGISQMLWVTSAALIVWAAIEQIALPKHAAEPASQGNETYAPRADRSALDAALPATTVAILLTAGIMSGSLGGSPFMWLAVGLALLFSLFSGLREHWIINTQRTLRADVDKGRKLLTGVIESTSDSVIVVDRNWNIEYFNQNAVRSVGGSTDLRLGASLWKLFPTEVETETSRRYRVAMETQRPITAIEYFGDVWFDIRAYPTSDGLSIFFRDVSAEKQARDELEHLASHDPLTDLANRTVFHRRLQEVVRSGRPFAVLLLDVDHFKELNDTLGHPVGDLLLKSTGERLKSSVSNRDHVARLGGDEFVILAEGANAADAEKLALRIVEAAAPPHVVDGEAIRLGVSIGIALSDSDIINADRVFRNADIALYAAKTDTRGAFRVFEPSMEMGLQERQALRADLRAALGNDEFELYYKPLVDLRTETVCSFEALLRWRHPTRGLISPDLFIPIAEESGLIVAIGNWVLNTASAEAAKWPAAISVAVNLSTREFASGNLADNVSAALKASSLDAARLELEITESVLLKNSRANLTMLHKLRALGVRIALDDFGTGYSSLAYLQQFPFSKIKIDRSFIKDLPQSDASQAIVRSVIGLGLALGMRVTAEGVETRAHYDWVKLGCTEAQGYFLSRPVPASEVPAVVARLNAVDSEPVARLAG